MAKNGVRVGKGLQALALTAAAFVLLSCQREEIVAERGPWSTRLNLVEKAGVFTKSYSFSGLNCETGEQRLEASSAARLRAALCDRLQDADVNKGCAESARLDLFISSCANSVWAPRAKAFDPALHVRGGERNLRFDRRAQEVLSALPRFRVLEARAVAGLPAALAPLADSVAALIAKLDLSNSQALFGSWKPGLAGALLSFVDWPIEKQTLLIASENPPVASGWPQTTVADPLHLVFRFASADLARPPTLEVYHETFTCGFRAFRECLAHAASMRKIVVGRLEALPPATLTAVAPAGAAEPPVVASAPPGTDSLPQR